MGDERSIARTITLVENGSPGAREAISLLYRRTGRAAVIGVTGPPGVGKSTLTERLVRAFRGGERTVGVVAVDPSSPYSGGAFLGDRVRMPRLSADRGVFIRSMATRGGPGGLPATIGDVVRVLDASGKDVIIIETAGAGQSDVEIMRVAETVVVVLAPGLGDEIQALKAGLTEIGDIFVVNKMDLANADKAVLDIRTVLEMRTEGGGWRTPVVKTNALTGEGTEELLAEIERHREHLEAAGLGERRRRRAESEVVWAIRRMAAEHVIASLKGRGRFEELVRRVMNHEEDPYAAAEDMLKGTLKAGEPPERRAGAAPPAVPEGMRRRRLRVGLTQVYTGKGKGKTSAAFGLALRAIGRGLRVYVIQFIKGGFDYGELHIADRLPNLEIAAFGCGRLIKRGAPTGEDLEQARVALERAEEIVGGGEYDIVVLDEVNVAVDNGLIGVEEVVDLIKKKPGHVELVLTGRSVHPDVVKLADLVTEMREIKHPFRRGIGARWGIEY